MPQPINKCESITSRGCSIVPQTKKKLVLKKDTSSSHKKQVRCRLSLSMCRHTGQRQDSTHDVDIWRNSDGRFDTGYQKQRCTIGDLTRWEKGSKGGDDLTPDVKWRGPKEGDLTLDVRLPAGRGSKGDFDSWCQKTLWPPPNVDTRCQSALCGSYLFRARAEHCRVNL